MAMSVFPSACLSVCLSSVVHMRGLFENYQTDQRENLRQYWDHENRLSDAEV